VNFLVDFSPLLIMLSMTGQEVMAGCGAEWPFDWLDRTQNITIRNYDALWLR
jgi:hypothetical protein